MLDDVIYEVDPSGEIVWNWIASEHIAEFGFSRKQLTLLHNTNFIVIIEPTGTPHTEKAVVSVDIDQFHLPFAQ